MLAGTFCSATLALGGLALGLPRAASASWLFSVTRASGTPAPILHDANLDLLSAPISTDVDATIPNTPITSDGSALVSGVDLDGQVIQRDADNASDTVTTPTNTSGAISTYTVKAGDSLSQIAENFGVSVNTILWANNITDRSTIKPGDTLVILPVSGIQHTVRSGETLSSIAAKYGGDASDIAQFNGLSAGSALQAGSTIIIPGGSFSASSATSASSGSTTKKTTSRETSGTTTKLSTGSSSSAGTGKINYSDETGNPYIGGSGAALSGFFTNPLPGAILTQGIHGWNAVDLGAHTGTPILAAASGTVILSRMGGWNGGYGNYVILDNGHGVETLYAHMSETKATVGDSVSAGQVIGYVGMTGDATGPHLHFEVRGAANPFRYCRENDVCSPQ
ncbi:MAG: LysM peptidoglycan-binding domain-containing M23 family metallopeptidase [Candidatus Pacebacteria bacterium]|nr:LysM peptidoglycan-binding domain-containing M23 family metallopeptidase [Candidatus Paceibacterota bacterium]